MILDKTMKFFKKDSNKKNKTHHIKNFLEATRRADEICDKSSKVPLTFDWVKKYI